MLNIKSSSISISVIITTFNREKWIKRAIDSALNQSVEANEVIIVDDGSTDRTGEVLSLYNESIKIVKLENDGTGQTRPLNIGTSAASSDIICLLDSDDRLNYFALENHLKIYSKYP